MAPALLLPASMVRNRRVGAIVVPVVLVAGLLSEILPAQESFSELTDVVVVDIPVQVVANGKPVRGLTADDFLVSDGRKKREIIDFEAIDLQLEAGDPSSAGDIPPSGRRHFLFLFDVAMSQPSAVLRARKAAREVVTESLHPSDLVGVGFYSTAGSQVILGFTHDRAQIETAIDTLGMRSLLYGSPDPLGIVLANQPPGSLPVTTTFHLRFFSFKASWMP